MVGAKKNVVRKRPGRPATGQDPVTAIRVSGQLRQAVDKWAENQADQPGRSEAIRRLVEIGLTVRTPTRTTVNAPARASRARELAAETINKIGDPAASSEERAERRQRLTKGPTEFREVRVDRPKAKK
jgi:hypothetical protein